MSAQSLLEFTLWDILRIINPLKEDWEIRFHIIDELRDVVQAVESLRGVTVEPYGSFVSNLFSRWGDLDISIEIPNGSHISTAGKKHKQSLLRDLLKALKKKGGCHKLQFISNARVPIIKFESNYHNISCDISINNLSAQMKSKILFWINEIDGRFRNMVLLVKEWAKAHEINNPKLGTFNSYCLSLLVIFHFQTCVPAILPPLKEIYPGNMAEDLAGVRSVAEKRIESICAENIYKIKSDRSRMINNSSLSELFVSFIGKFSEIGLKASEQAICLYTGQWEDIASNMRWLPKTYALFVEDPFEQPANAARTVGSRQLMKMPETFQTSHYLLASANQNQTSLISTLVRPQISRFMNRMPVRNPGNKGVNCHRNHQPLPRPMYSTQVPLQQQFQNLRVDEHPNNGRMHRPVQVPNSQGQQKWRPRSNR